MSSTIAATAADAGACGGLVIECRYRYNVCSFSFLEACPSDSLQIYLQSENIKFYSPSKNATLSFKIPDAFSLDLRDVELWNPDREWATTEDGTWVSLDASPTNSTYIKCQMVNPPRIPVPGIVREETFATTSQDRACEIRCQKCLTSMFESAVVYKRIMPLPLSELSALSNEWFCHPVREYGSQRHGNEQSEASSSEPGFKLALKKIADTEELALARADIAKAASSKEEAAAAESMDTTSDKSIQSSDRTTSCGARRTPNQRPPTRKCTAPSGTLPAKHSLAGEDDEEEPPDEKMKKFVHKPSPEHNKLLLSDNELFFTLNKFVTNENTLSHEVKERILGDSILCPTCNVIVGTVTPFEAQSTIENIHHQVAFDRVRVLLEDTETKQVLDKLTDLNLVARLLRQLIAYKFQIRLFLLSESSPDVLILWVMENDLLVYTENFVLENDTSIEKEVDFVKKHKVLYKKTVRDTEIVASYMNRVDVLRQKVQQATLDKTYEHLTSSTPKHFAVREEFEFEEYQLGFIDASI